LGARSSPAVQVELDPVSLASHWPKLVTQLAIINGHACMHSRKVIKIQGGERDLPGSVFMEDEEEA